MFILRLETSASAGDREDLWGLFSVLRPVLTRSSWVCPEIALSNVWPCATHFFARRDNVTLHVSNDLPTHEQLANCYRRIFTSLSSIGWTFAIFRQPPNSQLRPLFHTFLTNAFRTNTSLSSITRIALDTAFTNSLHLQSISVLCSFVPSIVSCRNFSSFGTHIATSLGKRPQNPPSQSRDFH